VLLTGMRDQDTLLVQVVGETVELLAGAVAKPWRAAGLGLDRQVGDYLAAGDRRRDGAADSLDLCGFVPRDPGHLHRELAEEHQGPPSARGRDLTDRGRGGGDDAEVRGGPLHLEVMAELVPQLRTAAPKLSSATENRTRPADPVSIRPARLPTSRSRAGPARRTASRRLTRAGRPAASGKDGTS
jgi:hypothetical protein